MIDPALLQKYNVPTPRYTSYPPANYFTESFTTKDYEEALMQSGDMQPEHLSFYVHIPFCRQLCHYCGCNSFAMTTEDQKIRYISALHKEIETVVRRLNPSRRIAQIHYGGGSPTILPVNIIKELNEHLLSAFSCIEKPEIAIECHPGYLEEKDWLQLSEAGFNRISIGVQDFNEKVLNAVNRCPSLLPMETVFRILREKKCDVNLDFIYGLPFQTEESFAETIRQAIELQPDRLVTFSYAHVPWVNKRQKLLEEMGLPESEEKSRMYIRAKGLLSKAGYQAIGLDHFVKKTDELYMALQNGQLHRNFQGYCTRRTTGQVYAFGATAISQLSMAYAQNSKDIEDYIARAENGLATVKGYRLNAEEQIAREVIETWMCNYSLDWVELSERLSLPVEKIKEATAYNPQLFSTFVEDEIITMDENRIRITEQGTLFVRNIAAALDRLMIHSDKSFSKPI